MGLVLALGYFWNRDLLPRSAPAMQTSAEGAIHPVRCTFRCKFNGTPGMEKIMVCKCSSRDVRDNARRVGR
jgi:hypothetical protein